MTLSKLPSGLFLFLAIVLLTGCEQTPMLDRLIDQGKLKVGASRGPIGYYQDQDGPAGFEYELIKGFADSLGVEVEFVSPPSLFKTISMIRKGKLHFAATGLPITAETEKTIRFSRPYLTTSEHLLYRRGSYRPKSLADVDYPIQILPETGHINMLKDKRKDHLNLQWKLVKGADLESLITELNEGKIKYMIANEHEFKHYQYLYPYIDSAFKLENERLLGWAFQKNQDSSLVQAANQYLSDLDLNGTLKALIDKYYGATAHLNFVDKRNFWRHVAQRLPPLEDCFKAAAKETGIDWRLLAAVGYQESHWYPLAKSPTGVQGIMMLTEAAAKDISVSDRSDPRQSIRGGARYLLDIKKRIPERISEPDSLWFALAGYNVGFGHLEDARILTQRQSGNPDSWNDVKQRLPLLSQEKYYKSLKHGYARGREPVVYVKNIQRYYKLMMWHTSNDNHQIHVNSSDEGNL